MPRRLQPKVSTGRSTRKFSDEQRQIWKPSSTHPNIWFHSINGHTYELKGCSLFDLTDEETRALQKVSLAKLQSMNLGVSVIVPKDESSDGKNKESGGLLLKVRRSHTTNITQLLDILKDREKDGEKQEENGIGVFGIPLGKCVANDEERSRRRSQQSVRSESSAGACGSASTTVLGVPTALTQSTSQQNLASTPTDQQDDSGVGARSLPGSDSSSDEDDDSNEESNRLRMTTSRTQVSVMKRCSSGSSTSPVPSGSGTGSAAAVSSSTSISVSTTEHVEVERKSSSASTESTLTSQSRRFLIDDPLALAAQVNKSSLTVPPFVVPKIVVACCKYLEQNGLNTVGLFRIGSSKKRLKELKDEYDSGRDIIFDDSCNPHDAATLLKEFFRDLPEPLLTRDLFNAFLATNKKMNGTATYLPGLQCLITLLPRLNRNTLWKLLLLLDAVAKSSTDTVDQQGRPVVGNKMDAHNLASMLGPNILHKSKPGSSSEWSSAPSSEQKQEQILEEQTTVANVVHDLIVHHRELYTIPAALYDEVLRTMNEVNPEDVHFILSCRLRGVWPPPPPPGSPVGSQEGANNDSVASSSTTLTYRKVSLGAESFSSVPPKRQQSFSGQAPRRVNALSMSVFADAHRTMSAMAQSFLENVKDETSDPPSPSGEQVMIRITKEVDEQTTSGSVTVTSHGTVLRECSETTVRRTQESSILSATSRSPTEKAPSPSLQRYCRR